MTLCLDQARHRRHRTNAVVLSCALLLATAAHSGPTPAATQPQGPDPKTHEKAIAIIEAHTPDSPVYVRPFDSGLRVLGVTVESAAAPPANDADGGPRFEWNPPEWLDRDRLLQYVDSGETITVRLLWRAEDTRRIAAGPQSFVVALNQHQGYYKISQHPATTVIEPSAHLNGGVFWTEHAFSPASTIFPGLFDLVVRRVELPATTRPLGEVFIRGRIGPPKDSPRQLENLFPNGAKVFASKLTMTQWYTYHVPVQAPSFQPRALALITSLDWIKNDENMVEVAEVVVHRASGEEENHLIKLGRDTANTWYDFHTRGNLRHTKAPVAWSWPVEQENVRFDAAVYQAVFPLSGSASPLTGITINYLLDEGVLRLHGIVLLP